MNDPQLLIYGELTDRPILRTDKRDKKYTVAHVRTQLGNEELTVFVLTYAQKVGETLQGLFPGDVVALSGHLRLREHDGRTAIGMAARRIISIQPEKLHYGR